jgi:hypothetical protein
MRLLISRISKERKDFFFEKKKQKTLFDSGKPISPPTLLWQAQRGMLLFLANAEVRGSNRHR